MTTQSEQTVPFSLSTPIPKGAKWYFRSIYQQDWYRSSFESNVWTMTTFASTTTTSGTVYYYKPFHGVENMSAVETVFRYRYGIIAYLNGFEIYRDKMPLGEVNRMTLSTVSYSSYDYRGVIRPALFIHNDNKNHLAVELHYPNSDLRSSIDFDAYLALLPGATGQNCYVYPYDTVSYTHLDVYKRQVTRDRQSLITRGPVPYTSTVSNSGNWERVKDRYGPRK